MTHLGRTSAILEVIEAAADSGDLPGPTQSFLAQYLAVVMYSEMEEKVADIVKSHLEKFTHESVATFVTSSLNDVIKRVPKSDISKLAARFGESFRVKFNKSLDDRKITIYSNVISARHEIGHKRGSNISLSEVKMGCAAADYILETLLSCLSENEPNFTHTVTDSLEDSDKYN